MAGFTPYYLLNGTRPENCDDIQFPTLFEVGSQDYSNSVAYHKKNKEIHNKNNNVKI